MASLFLASCAADVSQPIVSKEPAQAAASVTDLVGMIETATGSTCEFDHHNETVGATDSGTCTVADGDLYVSVYDDPDKLAIVANRFTDPDKGEASLSGPNWIINGVDEVIEGIYNTVGGTLYTASGHYCMRDGAVAYCV